MKQGWYFLRLAFLAIPWKARSRTNPRGTLFIRHFLVKAVDAKSAFRKAQRILKCSEMRDGSASLEGAKVTYDALGIMDLEPLCEKWVSGAEVSDHSEVGVPLGKAKRQLMSRQRMAKLIAYERKDGKPPLLEVWWGDDFGEL